MTNLSNLLERFLRVASHYWRWHKLVSMWEKRVVGFRQDKRRWGDWQSLDATGLDGDAVSAAMLDLAVYCEDQSEGGRLLAKVYRFERNGHSARKALLKIGRFLAVELERNGEDSTTLLHLLNVIDGGGGAATALPLWQSLKADLQRIAIRWKLPTVPGKPEAMPEGHPADNGRPALPDAQQKKPKATDMMSMEAKALAAITDHPDWTDTAVAEAIGCNRTSLYRLEKYQAARELLKQGRDSMPRGSKSRDGDLEAWDR